MNQIIEFIFQNPYITLIGATCILEIAPIKIDPWSAIFRWVGKQVNGRLESKILELDEKVDHLTEDVSEERIQNKRWSILRFSNSCRSGVQHTKEEWDHCIDELTWYEDYCQDNDIKNGVIEQNSRWLRNRYHDHLDKDDFIKH